MALTLHIHGLGHFNPENVIDNRFLEELGIGTTDEWILERVGIRARRTVLPLDYLRETKNADWQAGQEAALYSNAETGKRASLLALERAGLKPSDIGLVIAGGCAPDRSIPAEACSIAAALGIEAPSLDIASACSSFGAQLHLLSRMLELPPYVLVVNAENNTRVVDYRDRATAVLWGDGSSAAVVSTEVPARLRLVRTALASSPAGADDVVIPRHGHFRQNGSVVQRFAIKSTGLLLEALLPEARERAARTGGRFRFVGHQANLLMLQAVARRAELGPDEHWSDVEEFGNTAAAGAPSVLSRRWNELQGGDVIALAVVGSGLTWASALFEVEAG